ncbi:MAG: DNA-processing protein DprA [Candidatus Limnocylindrales bacterium]
MSETLDQERDAWLALASVPGVGEHAFARLTAVFGSAEGVLTAARQGTLRRQPPTDAAGRRLRRSVVDGIEAVARQPEEPGAVLRAHGVWTVTPFDAGYPPRFDVLPVPPPVLYGWGRPAALRAARSVAIVGTRRPTAVGRSLAARLARRSVELSATVVSGLAFGIDGAAHAATIEAGGQTVAIIAGGHAEPGPRAHRRLVSEIIDAGGAVISEVPPLVRPEKGSFPRRNRLIAALADVTIVVEAPMRSGALNTAHHALEQGRPLFIAPGRPGDPSVAGCLRLLRETPAIPVVDDQALVQELLEIFAAHEPATPLDRLARPAHGQATTLMLAELGPVERRVAIAVVARPGTLDDLVDATGLTPGTLAGAISLLHLRGLVRLHGASVLPSGSLLDGRS